MDGLCQDLENSSKARVIFQEVPGVASRFFPSVSRDLQAAVWQPVAGEGNVETASAG